MQQKRTGPTVQEEVSENASMYTVIPPPTPTTKKKKNLYTLETFVQMYYCQTHFNLT